MLALHVAHAPCETDVIDELAELLVDRDFKGDPGEGIGDDHDVFGHVHSLSIGSDGHCGCTCDQVDRLLAEGHVGGEVPTDSDFRVVSQRLKQSRSSDFKRTTRKPLSDHVLVGVVFEAHDITGQDRSGAGIASDDVGSYGACAIHQVADPGALGDRLDLGGFPYVEAFERPDDSRSKQRISPGFVDLEKSGLLASNPGSSTRAEDEVEVGFSGAVV